MNQINRVAKTERKTKETVIWAKVNLDGSGKNDVSTGTKFLDHMIAALSTHSLIDIEISAKGDLKHHTIEDAALVLGEAFSNALGDRNGISRFGSSFAPMDESLAFASVDLVKRTYFVGTNLDFNRNYIEDIAREDLQHFFRSLCDSLKCTMHIRIEYGSNDHHKAEACFKALALALRQAVSIDPRRLKQSIPSSKGKM
jgi:imidazoleglycerol-phosphate dehydratase